MTSLFPHTSYPEELPNAKAILALHVLRSGAPAGVAVSLPVATLMTFLRGPRTLPGFMERAIISSGRGLIWGTALSGLALAGRMWGREHIEWQDRSWRLQENRYQSEVDWWIFGGAGAGAVAALVAARRGRMPVGLAGRTREVVFGGTGLGTVAGTLGYVGWRHGVNGGKYADER